MGFKYVRSNKQYASPADMRRNNKDIITPKRNNGVIDMPWRHEYLLR